ncbi:hypothetical protein NNJEOMEG_02280 [Fundidesulfovibrio magnetotacticus]|uniref:Uncharacterized protein n=1 Tax=Fundidesulfovibrio magnetotacticus TaxID=2730080 RepID=A0A6V8M1V7_9BACT|nr:DUF1804 family protein [Fundidesulfovibrio magnetotacticus]GFK94435.1 hypothetical protein NNJEOMEG_02280 [Fundidesulfovibrio magnetotacticus]
MAHAREKREAVRAAFIHERLPLEIAALKASVPLSTAARWKRRCKELGDDWDKLRAACLLAGDGVESVARQMLADYVVAHKAIMDAISTDQTIEAKDKVSMLASLADSFNKTVAASKRVLPETSELATALAVLNKLSDFIRARFPQHGPAFVEVLEPFGAEIARAYG